MYASFYLSYSKYTSLLYSFIPILIV